MRRVKQKFWALSLIGFAFMGQNAEAFGLHEVFLLAQKNDARYQAALAQFDAAKIDLPLARSARKPTVRAILSATQNHDTSYPDSAAEVSANTHQTRLALQLNQLIYSADTTLSIELVKRAEGIAKLQFRLAEETLIGETVDRYFAVLSALDNEQLAQLEHASIKNQLELSVQRLEVGLATQTDKFEAEARLASSQAGLIAAQNETLNATQDLQSLSHHAKQISPNEIRRLDNNRLSPKINTGEEWVSAAVQRNAAYQIKRQQRQIKQLEFDAAYRARLPSFAWVANLSRSDSQAGLQSVAGKLNNWHIGLEGSVPVYSGGAIQLKKVQSAHALEAVKFELEQLHRDTERAIQVAGRAVLALQKQSQALDQAVIASASALAAKEQGFRAGVDTNLSVLNAQRDLYRARRDHLKAGYDLINAVVAFARNSGDLNEATITRIETWLK